MWRSSRIVVGLTLFASNRVTVTLSRAQSQSRGVMSKFSRPPWTNTAFLSKIMRTEVTGVVDKELASLWTGYGSIQGLELSTRDINSQESTQKIICKVVKPPESEGEAHQRDVKSYLSEADFYKLLANDLNSAGIAVPQVHYLDYTEKGEVLMFMSDLTVKYPVQCGFGFNDFQTECAIDWLARFHAFSWERNDLWTSTNIWKEGCFWRFDVRRTELTKIPEEWTVLKRAASGIADLLRDGTDPSNQFKWKSLVHGDFKGANLMFTNNDSGDNAVNDSKSNSDSGCAGFDFQWVGGGYGARDVVRLMIVCVDLKDNNLETNKQIENKYLQRYYNKLCYYVRKYHGKDIAADGYYPISHLQQHYELCLMDYIRFCVGWKIWGNTQYAFDRTKELLEEINDNKSLNEEEFSTALKEKYLMK